MQSTSIFSNQNKATYLDKTELIHLKDLSSHYATITAKELAYILFSINKHSGNVNVAMVAHTTETVDFYRKLCPSEAVHVDEISERIKVVTPHITNSDSFNCPLILMDTCKGELMNLVILEFKILQS